MQAEAEEAEGEREKWRERGNNTMGKSTFVFKTLGDSFSGSYESYRGEFWILKSVWKVLPMRNFLFMRSFKESRESEEEEEWKQKKNLMDFLLSLFPLK